MKLSITDTFLWNLYTHIETIDRAFDLFAPGTMREALYPDLLRLRREYGRRKDRQSFSKLIYYLQRKGYIKRGRLQQRNGVVLTPKGGERVLRIKLANTKKQKRADSKWQMVIFDIPEKKRLLRDIFREVLLNLGYQKLQHSVWVCPYDVFEETDGVIKRYSLEPYARLFLIEEKET